MGDRLVVAFDVDRIDPCDDSSEKEEKEREKSNRSVWGLC